MTPSTPLPEQGGFNERLKDVLRQSIQFTELGSFPEAVPTHSNWVNVMGRVYAFDFTVAKQAIRTLILEEIIGEDEHYGPKLFKPARNELRAEQRKKLGGTNAK